MTDQACAIERTFSYRDVLAVLTKAFAADDDVKAGSLKGRLKHFQGHGLAPPASGKGRDIRYTVSDVYDWGFALTLAQLGLPPRFIIKNVRRGRFAREEAAKIDLSAKDGRQTYIGFFPSLFLESMPVDADPLTWLVILEAHLQEFFAMCLKNRAPFSVSNLSEMKRKIDEELAALR